LTTSVFSFIRFTNPCVGEVEDDAGKLRVVIAGKAGPIDNHIVYKPIAEPVR